MDVDYVESHEKDSSDELARRTAECPDVDGTRITEWLRITAKTTAQDRLQLMEIHI
ncbi:MAG: hypothetical protein AAFU79_06020 [Myxococcota bacterium]